MTPPRTVPPARRDPLFLLLAAAFVAYALAFVWRTSFVIDGERYFSLFDDAMISMRYARNLAEGHGLVWNPGGQRVEGITNPLWTLWMALLHLLPVRESKLALLVQLTGVGALAANLYVVRQIALRVSAGSRAVALGAVLLTATYLPLNNWTLQGMEVGVLALLVSGAVLLVLRALEAGTFPWGAYLALGIGTWVRPDAVVPLVAVWAFLAWTDRPRRRRHLAVGLAALLFFVGAQTGLRLWYYGEALPNTYYLKMTGYPTPARVSRGAWALMAMVWYANPFLVLLPLALPWLRPARDVLLLLAVVGLQTAYSVWVGGDAWESWGGANRYLSVVAPLWLVLLASAAHRVTEHAVRAWRAHRPTLPRHAGRLAWALLLLLAAVHLNALKGPRSLAEWVLARPPMTVRENEEMVRLGLWLRQHTRPDATVALRWAGATPYFARRPAVDLLGKSDPVIARLPMLAPPAGPQWLVSFWPGHLKWDFDYSIGVLRPQVVVNTDAQDPLLPYLRAYRRVAGPGPAVWVREGSDALLRGR
ncbi:MAG TPA: hypothetical protein VEW03_03565 [Longimicrobiaceae bacterium]|nr:hypothetical protein [Longimicrobiaceae bacterium]